MNDTDTRRIRKIEEIINDSDSDKAERIFKLFENSDYDKEELIKKVIEECKDYAEVETEVYINESFILKNLGV